MPKTEHPPETKVASKAAARAEAKAEQLAEATEAAAATPAPAQIAQSAPVRRELAKATGKPVPGVKLAHAKEHKVWLASYALATIALAGLHFALRVDALAFLGPRPVAFLARFLPAAFFAALTLCISKAVGMYAMVHIEDRASRFNVERVRRLLTGLAVAAIAVTNLVADWKTTVVSLGLVSLLLGFALQTPITSFIGWIYILVRQPYRVGDRVQIDEAKGDVIDVSYLDTTLWECGGPALSSDHPSGRVIKIPNRKVLDATVFNSSWPLFPYVWNEVGVQIGYQADLEFVAKTMIDAATEEMGEQMRERIETYKTLLAKTPVDEMQVKDEPVVLFRVDPNTWIQATVRYLVLPRHAGSTRSRLLKKIVERLNAEPQRAMLPKTDAR